MKKLKVFTGFLPPDTISYNGQYIMKVKETKEEGTMQYFCLENDVWIRKIGTDKYVTDWTNEEIWGRVQEIQYSDSGEVVSGENLGFILLQVDRRNGIIFDLAFRDTNITVGLKG